MADQETGRTPGDRPAQAVGQYGEHTAKGGVSFRCGACSEVAAMVKLVRAGGVVDMGTPLGQQRQSIDGVIIDYWLGSTCWMAVMSDRWARIETVLGADCPDPAALYAISWDLAPFWCRDCQRCYYRGDWRRTVIFDGPFYDYTDGECPAGHRHIIDD
jgi:hypothetical protein